MVWNSFDDGPITDMGWEYIIIQTLGYLILSVLCGQCGSTYTYVYFSLCLSSQRRNVLLPNFLGCENTWHLSKNSTIQKVVKLVCDSYQAKISLVLLAMLHDCHYVVEGDALCRYSLSQSHLFVNQLAGSSVFLNNLMPYFSKKIETQIHYITLHYNCWLVSQNFLELI